MRKNLWRPLVLGLRAGQLLLSLLLASLLALAAGPAARAQATLHKDLKKDFGALGDGRTNDLAAFTRAADFFNKRAQTPAGAGRAVLRIPAGTYRVGSPGPGSLPGLLQLTGCRNLTIVGDDSARTLIRYADSLRYGSFDPATHLPYEAASAYFTDPAYAVSQGVAIALLKCDKVEVANLSLDGNSAHLLVGGHWGDTGIQLGADGLFVGDSRRITLRRLAVHHFGRDGVQVLNHLAKNLDDPNQEAILLEGCRFDYNGRQGLSITGANGLRAIGCSFSHTGRVVIPALGKALYSNPGAGVDLEPEAGYVLNVRLENCRLVDNAGQGVVSDRYGDGPPSTKNVVLSNCLLWGLTNWSAWIRQTDFLFENCRIYGAFVTGCAAAAYPTRFVGCTFEDRAYHGQPAYGPYLLYSDREARRMSFTNCRFVGTRGYLLLARPASADSASAFRLRGCTFVLDYAEPPLGAANVLAGAVFSGDNVFQNGPLASSPVRSEFQLGSPLAGAAPVRLATGHLQLLAPNSVFTLQNGLEIGLRTDNPAQAATVEVGAGTTLVLGEQPGQQPTLYVGPAAHLVVHKGGALVLRPHTRMQLAGQLLVEDGATFFQDPLAAVATNGAGALTVGSQASRTLPPSLASPAP